jgi:FkbM family methyltransferase
MNLKTSHKIFLAKILFHTLMGFRRLLGLGTRTTVERSGILWELDLNEGIDLAIYLFGRFEPETIKLYDLYIKEGDIVLDIGANLGSHTLPLALKAGDSGKVHAFEPTKFAFQKLTKNVELNPILASRINLCQVMFVGRESEQIEPRIFSSWPLDGEKEDLHEKHKGKLMSTDGAVALTLDSWAKSNNLECINFIKIDVDGHEYSVLSGGKNLLYIYKPMIMMELAPYVFKGPSEFDGLINLLKDVGYEILDIDTKKKLPVDPAELRKLIPDGGSKNVLLTC